MCACVRRAFMSSWAHVPSIRQYLPETNKMQIIGLATLTGLFSEHYAVKAHRLNGTIAGVNMIVSGVERYRKDVEKNEEDRSLAVYHIREGLSLMNRTAGCDSLLERLETIFSTKPSISAFIEIPFPNYGSDDKYEKTKDIKDLIKVLNEMDERVPSEDRVLSLLQQVQTFSDPKAKV